MAVRCEANAFLVACRCTPGARQQRTERRGGKKRRTRRKMRRRRKKAFITV